jgi:superkiller protein 3
LAEAISRCEEAVRLKPGEAKLHNNLGAAMFRAGRVAEAIGHYETAVRLKPEYGDAHYNLGLALDESGRAAEAVKHYEAAVRGMPGYAEGHYRLGNALVQQGRIAEAVGRYAEAVRLKPEHVEARHNLGIALMQQGRAAEAVGQFRRAAVLEPRLVEALNAMAWILATATNGEIRNVGEAIGYAERACALTTNSVASYLDTLGVAYSEAGRFTEAVQAGEQGVARARAEGNNALAMQIESRLEYYREGRAYHTIPKGAGL